MFVSIARKSIQRNVNLLYFRNEQAVLNSEHNQQKIFTQKIDEKFDFKWIQIVINEPTFTANDLVNQMRETNIKLKI